jgi:hypothetical protein
MRRSSPASILFRNRATPELGLAELGLGGAELGLGGAELGLGGAELGLGGAELGELGGACLPVPAQHPHGNIWASNLDSFPIGIHTVRSPRPSQLSQM